MQSSITNPKDVAAGPAGQQDVVIAINNAIAARIGQQKFHIWFRHSTQIMVTDECIKVSVPNLFALRWIEGRFSSHIRQAASSVLGGDRQITFVIDAGLTPPQAGLGTTIQRLSERKRTESRLSSGSAATQAKPSQAARLTLDNFVVSRGNQLAYTAARAVIDEPKGPFNPLFIHGGYGLGKTHLLQGICNAVQKIRPCTRWQYMSAEDFVNQFVLALKTKKLEAFRNRIRQLELLAIDDIHFLAGKPSTQEEFLHTFNAIDLAGRQIVLVSDAHPTMISQFSDKLASRFISGMVVKITPPDFAARCRICRQYADAVKAHVPEQVINYIAEHLKDNVRQLEGAMLKLIAFSSLQGKKVDTEMAHEVAAEHLARTDPIVHISDIESAVAAYFGVTSSEMHSPRKDKTVTLARHFSMYLARKHTSMSSSELGRFMGGKNHATVLLACRKIEQLISRNSQLSWHGPAGNKVSTARLVLAHLEEAVAS